MGGFLTLFYKEVLRFRKVAFQTVLAPILTAMLYLLIFSHVLEGRVQVYPGVAYSSFLIPGLAMMSLLQNSFANSSSSIAQSVSYTHLTLPTMIIRCSSRWGGDR